MNFRSIGDEIYGLCEWLMRLALLNFLWIGSALAGLVILGWAPATTSVFAVSKELLLNKNNKDVKIARLFMEHYKKSFVSSNIIGFFLMFTGSMIYFSSQAIMEMSNSFFPRLILLVIAFLFIVILLFIFPVFTLYKFNLKNYIKYSLTIGIANLHYFFLFLFMLAILFVLYGNFPAFMVVYFMSLPASIIMHFNLNIFNKLETNPVSTPATPANNFNRTAVGKGH